MCKGDDGVTRNVGVDVWLLVQIEYYYQNSKILHLHTKINNPPMDMQKQQGSF